MSLTLANQFTICRLLTVPFFITAVLYYSPEKDFLRFVALGIFLVAVTLDLLDGFAARRLQQETKAGAILDPLADKILLISAYICLYKIGVLLDEVRFPIWLVVAVISRDAVLLIGCSVIQIVNGDVHIHPTAWGKMTVFFQVLAVCGILLQWPALSFTWYIILTLVIISGVDYLIKGVKDLNNGTKK